MTISLTRELELLVEEKIKSGLYPTAREVIREGLRLLDERDRLYDARLADLQKEIRKGLTSGRATAFNPESLKKKVRTTAYRGLPADERQEFRLPALLKEHLARVVALSGQSITEYITEAVAERVTQDLAATAEWALTVDEQVALLKILASDETPSARANEVAERARALFGELSTANVR